MTQYLAAMLRYCILMHSSASHPRIIPGSLLPVKSSLVCCLPKIRSQSGSASIYHMFLLRLENKKGRGCPEVPALPDSAGQRPLRTCRLFIAKSVPAISAGSHLLDTSEACPSPSRSLSSTIASSAPDVELGGKSPAWWFKVLHLRFILSPQTAGLSFRMPHRP